MATDASDGQWAVPWMLGGGNIQSWEKKLEEGTQAVGSAAVDGRGSHINLKELEALKKALTEHKEELTGRRVIWYTDSVTARAAIARQGSQNLKGKIWDLAQKQDISTLPKSAWKDECAGRWAVKARTTIRGMAEGSAQLFTEWGPLNQDPCGVTRPTTVPLESLEWANGRSLLWPKIRQIPEIVELLEKVAARKRPSGIIPTWKRIAVIIVPAWKKTNWWNTLEGMAQEKRSLGRLSLGTLTAWEQRNAHPSEWSAFLIPTEKPGGPRRHEPSMLEYEESLQGGSSGLSGS